MKEDGGIGNVKVLQDMASGFQMLRAKFFVAHLLMIDKLSYSSAFTIFFFRKAMK